MRPLLAAVLCCLLLATGCSSLEGSGNKGYVDGDNQLSLVARPDRGEPIALSGEDLDGNPLDLADLRGKPTLIAIWGAWCGPCNAEAPELVDVARKLEGTANVVGIDVRDPSQAQAQSFVRKYEVPYPSFYSPDGKDLLAFAGTLAPNSVPATVVLDAEGRVAAVVPGAIPGVNTMVDVVHDVVSEGSTDG